MRLTVKLLFLFDDEVINKLIENSQEITEESIQTFLSIEQNQNDFKARFSDWRSQRMKELFDHQLDKNIQLHEGFNKICGLKGSKLSGGQK